MPTDDKQTNSNSSALLAELKKLNERFSVGESKSYSYDILEQLKALNKSFNSFSLKSNPQNLLSVKPNNITTSSANNQPNIPDLGKILQKEFKAIADKISPKENKTELAEQEKIQKVQVTNWNDFVELLNKSDIGGLGGLKGSKLKELLNKIGSGSGGEGGGGGGLLDSLLGGAGGLGVAAAGKKLWSKITGKGAKKVGAEATEALAEKATQKISAEAAEAVTEKATQKISAEAAEAVTEKTSASFLKKLGAKVLKNPKLALGTAVVGAIALDKANNASSKSKLEEQEKKPKSVTPSTESLATEPLPDAASDEAKIGVVDPEMAKAKEDLKKREEAKEEGTLNDAVAGGLAVGGVAIEGAKAGIKKLAPKALETTAKAGAKVAAKAGSSAVPLLGSAVAAGFAVNDYLEADKIEDERLRNREKARAIGSGVGGVAGGTVGLGAGVVLDQAVGQAAAGAVDTYYAVQDLKEVLSGPSSAEEMFNSYRSIASGLNNKNPKLRKRTYNEKIPAYNKKYEGQLKGKGGRSKKNIEDSTVKINGKDFVCPAKIDDAEIKKMVPKDWTLENGSELKPNWPWDPSAPDVATDKKDSETPKINIPSDSKETTAPETATPASASLNLQGNMLGVGNSATVLSAPALAAPASTSSAPAATPAVPAGPAASLASSANGSESFKDTDLYKKLRDSYEPNTWGRKAFDSITEQEWMKNVHPFRNKVGSARQAVMILVESKLKPLGVYHTTKIGEEKQLASTIAQANAIQNGEDPTRAREAVEKKFTRQDSAPEPAAPVAPAAPAAPAPESVTPAAPAAPAPSTPEPATPAASTPSANSKEERRKEAEKIIQGWIDKGYQSLQDIDEGEGIGTVTNFCKKYGTAYSALPQANASSFLSKTLANTLRTEAMKKAGVKEGTFVQGKLVVPESATPVAPAPEPTAPAAPAPESVTPATPAPEPATPVAPAPSTPEPATPVASVASDDSKADRKKEAAQIMQGWIDKGYQSMEDVDKGEGNGTVLEFIKKYATAYSSLAVGPAKASFTRVLDLKLKSGAMNKAGVKEGTFIQGKLVTPELATPVAPAPEPATPVAPATPAPEPATPVAPATPAPEPATPVASVASADSKEERKKEAAQIMQGWIDKGYQSMDDVDKGEGEGTVLEFIKKYATAYSSLAVGPAKASFTRVLDLKLKSGAMNKAGVKEGTFVQGKLVTPESAAPVNSNPPSINVAPATQEENNIKPAITSADVAPSISKTEVDIQKNQTLNSTVKLDGSTENVLTAIANNTGGTNNNIKGLIGGFNSLAKALEEKLGVSMPTISPTSGPSISEFAHQGNPEISNFRSTMETARPRGF